MDTLMAQEKVYVNIPTVNILIWQFIFENKSSLNTQYVILFLRLNSHCIINDQIQSTYHEEFNKSRLIKINSENIFWI